MPRQHLVIRVFLSSPSDVAEERSVVGRIVDEINSTWSDALSARFVLIEHQSSVPAGIDSDPQQVINRHIGGDYDVYLGIMFSRFGTATPRAGSGTEEEFERALAQYRETDSKEIMFYFKTAAVPFDSLDPEQLAKVQTFRSKIGECGVYYKQFLNIEEFERLVRMNLGIKLYQFAAAHRPKGEGSQPNIEFFKDITKANVGLPFELATYRKLLKRFASALDLDLEYLDKVMDLVLDGLNSDLAGPDGSIQARDSQPPQIQVKLDRLQDEMLRLLANSYGFQNPSILYKFGRYLRFIADSAPILAAQMQATPELVESIVGFKGLLKKYGALTIRIRDEVLPALKFEPKTLDFPGVMQLLVRMEHEIDFGLQFLDNVVELISSQPRN